MRRFRLGAFTGVLATSAVIAFGASNCASPTQIIVDVRTDEVLCDTLIAGIVVTSPENAETDTAFELIQSGCESGTDRVGTLTITPSGATDATVAIRIVGGVKGTHPEKCGRTNSEGVPSWDNCILATRKNLQFVPGKTVPVTVVLSEQCVGQFCGPGRECNLGKCVKPEDVQDDGGNVPVPEGGQPYEDARPFPDDAVADAGVDACALCRGTTSTCDGLTGKCEVNCSNNACKDRVICGAGLDCTINCTANGSCDKTRCASTGTCTFNCTGNGQPRCTNIDCKAGSCSVTCESAENTCDGVTMEAGTSTMTCQTAPGLKPTCNNVACIGGSCNRVCVEGGLGCGPLSTCSGDCLNWQDAGDGG